MLYDKCTGACDSFFLLFPFLPLTICSSVGMQGRERKSRKERANFLQGVKTFSKGTSVSNILHTVKGYNSA